MNAEVQRQIGSGASVDVGYFRRWYGNFTVTDNTLVSPSDYSPCCVTAPSNDTRLPVAGQQVCGFYDINPNKNGQVLSVVRMADHYGEADRDLQRDRLLGELAHQGDHALCRRHDGTRRDEPVLRRRLATQQLHFCDVTPPFLTQYRLWRVSGAVGRERQRHVSGRSAARRAAARSTRSRPTMSRPTPKSVRRSIRDLASGATGTATVDLLKPFSLLGGHSKQLDLPPRQARWRRRASGASRLSLDHLQCVQLERLADNHDAGSARTIAT